MKDLGTSRILGNWQPSSLDVAVIETEIAAKVCQLLGIHDSAISWVRLAYPFHNRTVAINFPQVAKFHQDGDSSGCPEDMSMIMWSNVYPTKVRWVDNKLPLETKAGDLILVNNTEVEHKIPKLGNKDRWFVRIYF